MSAPDPKVLEGARKILRLVNDEDFSEELSPTVIERISRSIKTLLAATDPAALAADAGRHAVASLVKDWQTGVKSSVQVCIDLCSLVSSWPLPASAAGVPEENSWLRALDDELILAHLGVVKPTASYDEARAAIDQLIHWHVAVATDPAVNGGFKLVPAVEELEALPTVTVSADDARTIRRACLPANPNKMRSASPEVVAAVKRFIAALEKAHG